MMDRYSFQGGSVEDVEALAQRLTAFLARQGDLGPDVEVTGLTRMTGGYSLLMYRFDAKGSSGGGRYVLRINPPTDDAISHTDRTAEWSLLESLTRCGTVPVPATRWADLDGSHLGSPGFIVDFVDGPQLLAHLNQVGDEQARAAALNLATTIGAVHRDGLQGVPANLQQPSSWDDYVDGHIAEWRAAESRLAERDPFIRWLARWLETHKPPPAPLTLVHGEFQTANVVMDGDGAMQVVDWEYAHVGDPRIDLGWMQIVAGFTPPDPIALDPMAFCTTYCEATGLSLEVVNPLTVGYFAILAGAKALGSMLDGLTALASGQNHSIGSAYLVSSLPFCHNLWRQGVAGIEAATAQLAKQQQAEQAQQEVVSR
jgi:aminoglycoside phosphotransferase (APT) family kinase protein